MAASRAAAGLAAIVATLAAAVLPAPAVAGAQKADSSLADWRGEPTNLGGRAQISRGELVYTDYLYDDYGADLNGHTDPAAFRSSGQTSGDYRYPADPARFGDNAADLRELRLAADDRGLHGLVALQTMLDPGVAIATIAIDSDGDAGTGAGAWPGGAGITTPGADAFVTVWGDGARLTSADGATRGLRQATHAGKNAFEVDVPAAALELSPSARVWVGVGLAGPDGTYAAQSEGATALFDIGFQGAETYTGNSSWNDQRQSAALAAGDLGAFAGELRTRALERRRTRPLALEPGFYNRIFRSDHEYGEGVDLRGGGIAGTSSPAFLGRYQPYGLYIPAGYDPGRRAPLLLDLHSLNRNQNQFASLSPNQLVEFGDQRGSIMITPLGRATDGWYLEAGLLDVFEAWRDVRAAHRIDTRRTSIAGYSMGGYGTYRLGLLMPDRFARAVVHVGPQVFGIWAYPSPPLIPEERWRVASNTNLIVENALNLPYEITGGTLDELVPIAGVVHQAESFREAGNPYRFYHHATDDHFSFAFADVWSHSREWLADHRRVRNPARVRYRRYPSMDLAGAGMTFDGAYWVDGMVVRDAGAEDSSGAIDVTTDALGRGPGTLIDEGTTTIGPEQGGTSPAEVTGQHYEPEPRARPKNRFRVTLENLAAVELDAGRMGLDPQRTLRATLSGDGSSRLRLVGVPAEGVTARLDGRRVGTRGGSTLSLWLDLTEAGPHTLVISPPGDG